MYRGENSENKSDRVSFLVGIIFMGGAKTKRMNKKMPVTGECCGGNQTVWQDGG